MNNSSEPKLTQNTIDYRRAKGIGIAKYTVTGIHATDGTNHTIDVEASSESEALAAVKEQFLESIPPSVTSHAQPVPRTFPIVPLGWGLIAIGAFLGITVISTFWWLALLGFVLLLCTLDWNMIFEELASAPGKAKQREASERNRKRKQQSQILCPHCQQKGGVTTRPVKRKKGISGGKATAAVITGGVSVLATGLSRKENETEAKCSKCGSIWYH
jgi:hypothetical protein